MKYKINKKKKNSICKILIIFIINIKKKKIKKIMFILI